MHQREVEKAALAMELRGALTKDEEHRLRAQIIEKLECTKALQRANEDGNRRCLAMEEAFSKLKQITGVSSLVDMHEKFSSQVGDKSILLMEVKEAEAKLESVKAAQLRHQASFEDLQSSNSNFNNNNSNSSNNNSNNNNNNNSSGSTGSSSSGKGGYRVTSSGAGNEFMENGRAGTASMRVALKNNQSDITPSHSTKSNTNTNTNSNSNISDSSSNSNNNSSNSSPRGPVYPTPYSAFSPRQQDKLSEKAATILNSAGNGIGTGTGAGMRIERSGSTGGTDTVHRTRAANDK
jgi:hypothetical protein